jgi:secreted trypsin-like serine protease
LIIGGTEADINEFPHMVAIGFRQKGYRNYDYACGGSLISNQYVLTAAHCNKMNRRPLVVMLGTINLDSYDSKIEEIEKFISYPYYNSITNYGDIALIKLKNSLDFSDKLVPACLPKLNMNLEINSKATATGWGHTEYAGEATKKLHKVTLEILDSFYCRRLYGDKFNNEQICAGDLTGKKDTCQGGNFIKV